MKSCSVRVMMTSSSRRLGATTGAAVRAADAVMWAPEELPGVSGPNTPDDAGRSPTPHDEASIRAELMEDARRVAFDEGFRAGEDAERARLFQVARALHDGLASVQDGVDRWVANAEENIAALGVAVARHLLGTAMSVDREAVLDVVRLAITEFPVDHPVTVRLNPVDHPLVVALMAAADPDPGSRRETQWVADPRVGAGGCVVEGRERIVDGRVDAALERVYRRLTYTGA